MPLILVSCGQAQAQRERERRKEIQRQETELLSSLGGDGNKLQSLSGGRAPGNDSVQVCAWNAIPDLFPSLSECQSFPRNLFPMLLLAR